MRSHPQATLLAEASSHLLDYPDPYENAITWFLSALAVCTFLKFKELGDSLKGRLKEGLPVFSQITSADFEL